LIKNKTWTRIDDSGPGFLYIEIFVTRLKYLLLDIFWLLKIKKVLF